MASAAIMVMLLFLLFHAFCGNSQTPLERYRRNPVYDDQSCSGNALFTHNDMTLLQCTGTCSRDDSCLGVAFNANPIRCHGCTRPSFENLNQDMGFSIYQTVPESIAETQSESIHTRAALSKIGEDSDIRPTQILVIDNGFQRGDWSSPAFCRNGYYAVGFNMRVEPYQVTGDDTAVNSVGLKCYSPTSRAWAGEIRPHSGLWGDWRNFVYCDYSSGHVLKAVRAKVEHTGYDLGGLTNLRFQCGSLATVHVSKTIELPLGDPAWGNWGGWSDKCDPGYGICGARIRIQAHIGSGDDTAMNDIAVYCC